MTFLDDLKTEIEIQYGSVYHFSEVSGVSRPVFSKLFSKGIGSVSSSSLVKIARGLGIDYEQLKNGAIVPYDYTRMEEEKLESDAVQTDDPLITAIVREADKLDNAGKLKVFEYVRDILPKYGKE